jgi:energy-coupling factor transport system permease protein
MDLLRSLPLGLYLEQPVTWLHRIDSRVKLAWLMTFLLSPLLANPIWRITLVILLIILTISAQIPWRVWKQQMGWLLLLCLFVFIITLIAPDGLAVRHQPRLPSSDFTFVQPTDYRYVLLDDFRFSMLGFTITRRSLDIGLRVSSLLFTLVYSTNIYLLTTAPEEITAGLENLLQPLKRFKLPITEITLTLTLSLRFIPLVLEEIQNLARSIRTRAINWKKLGLKKSFQIWLLVAERLLENLLLRAEQIAIAMDVRGFTSPDTHQVQWHQLRLYRLDWIILIGLIPFWGMRFFLGGI